MKYLSIVFLYGLICSGQFLSAQEVLTDYSTAFNMALKENKSVIMLFVDGAKTNKQYQEFETNFLNSNDLESLKEQYVLYQVNCSSELEEGDVDLMYCRRLTRVYNANNVFPAVIMLNPRKEMQGELQTNFSSSKMKSYFKFLKSK